MNTEKKSINLFANEQEQEESTKLIRLAVNLKKASVALIAIYTLVITIFAFANFLIYQQKAQAKNQNQKLIQVVEAQRSKEGILQTLKNRISLARSLYAQSSKFPVEAIDDVFKTIPQNIELASLSADKEKISLSASSSNSGNVANFFSVFEKTQFPQITINTLSWGKERKFVFSVDIK